MRLLTPRKIRLLKAAKLFSGPHACTRNSDMSRKRQGFNLFNGTYHEERDSQVYKSDPQIIGYS